MTVTLLLILVTLELSTPVYSAPPTPKPQMGLCGILVTIVVACVIITIWIGLVKMCNKIPPASPPDPNTNNITLSPPYPGAPILADTSQPQFQFDRSALTNYFAFEPPVYDSAGNAYDVCGVYELDSTQDLIYWVSEGTVTQWLSGTTVTNTLSATETINLQETAVYQPNGALLYAYRSGVSNMTSVIPPHLNLPNDGGAQKLYRLAMLPQ